MKKKEKPVVDEKGALRAFVMPEMFPFLLEVYIKNGKSEEVLNEDIKIARIRYKELVSLSKQKAAQTPE